MLDRLPRPSIDRLCRIYGLLDDLIQQAVGRISSGEIGNWIGVPSHTVRKDISYLGELGPSPKGYDTGKLKSLIQTKLRLNDAMGVCIVGLNDLGAAFLRSEYLFSELFPVKAGFDSNINRLEILRTQVPLHPVRAIPEVVQKENIQIAVVTAVENWLENAIEKLLESGVQGIISFSPVEFHIKRRKAWFIRLNLANELRILSTLISHSAQGESTVSTATLTQE